VKRLRQLVLLSAMLVLVFAATARSDEPALHPIMHPDQATREEWFKLYREAPKAYLAPHALGAAAYASSIDLSGYLAWNSSNMSERNQWYCGNCWAWSGTGVLEVALAVQTGTRDRLSVQFINSCKSGNCPCCGGWLSDLATFYSTKGYAVPWSNSGASWQDSFRTCSSNGATCYNGPGVSCSSIGTSSKYTISSVSYTRIATQVPSSSAAIDGIKNIINQGKAVWFGFFMPAQADWTAFDSFWNNVSESALWTPPTNLDGQSWDSGGGGHAVLCVGYDSNSWIMLNSWGTTSNRPNGLFRVAMNPSSNYYNYRDSGNDYLFYFQTLNVTFATAATVANDDFDGAVVIPQPVYQYTEDTTGSTVASDDPSVTMGTCGSYFSGKGSHSVWYQYTPVASGNLTVTTVNSSYDTVLGVWTGTRGALQLASCNDDIDSTYQSRTTLSVSAGTTYNIEVMDYYNTPGTGGTLYIAMRPEMNQRDYVPIIMKDN
jgi:hypothetical protein